MKRALDGRPPLGRQIQGVTAALRQGRRRRFLITSHVNPDWDGLGAGMALASLLKRLGKQAVIAVEGGVPDVFRCLPRIAPVAPRVARLSADAAIVVDVPTYGRIGLPEEALRRIPFMISIDHHVSNQWFADVNWVDPKAAAVGQMVYRLFRAFRLKPTREEALCLYVSLVTDTGSFRYMNTTSAVHRIAAELIAAGVSPLKVSQELFEMYRPSDLKFLGKVLSRLRHSDDGRVAWLEVPWGLLQATQAGPEIEDELVNYPRAVRTAEVAFVLRQTRQPGKIRVSFRSKGNVDVDRIAQQFGGGGHLAASGCTIEGGMGQARRQVLTAVRQALQEKGKGRSR